MCKRFITSSDVIYPANFLTTPSKRIVSTAGRRTKHTLKTRAFREYLAFSILIGQPTNLWSRAFLKKRKNKRLIKILILPIGKEFHALSNFNWILRVMTSKVFNRRESCNDRRVFGPKAHSSVPLARYT